MPITWSSVAHFFASSFHDIVVGARAVVSHEAQIDKVGAELEGATAAVGTVVPQALIALEVERVAMACFGEFCALVHASGSAQKAAAAAPSADPQLLAQVESLLQKNPALTTQAAAMFGVKS